MGQAVFDGSQQHNKEQWAQTGTQEVSYEHEEKLIYFEGGRPLEQAAQRGCGLLLWRHSRPAWTLPCAIYSRELL